MQKQIDRALSGAVLIVDDDDALRELTVRMLTRRGFRALAAADGQEGLVLLTDPVAGVRAVLLDLVMPVLDGWSAYPLMRARRPDVPVYPVSGLVRAQEVAALGAEAVRNFLAKPFDFELLAARLQQHVAPEPCAAVPLGAPLRSVLAPRAIPG
jgi:hypothetical protein